MSGALSALRPHPRAHVGHHRRQAPQAVWCAAMRFDVAVTRAFAAIALCAGCTPTKAPSSSAGAKSQGAQSQGAQSQGTQSQGAPCEGATLVDLSHAYDGETIYWPTEEGFRLEKEFAGVTPGGWYYASNKLSTPEHGGTHVDAPIHFAAG